MTRELNLSSEFYKTKAILQAYAHDNETRFVASEKDVMIGVLEELSEDPDYSQSIYIDGESKLTNAEITYDRGTLTKYGRKAIDMFVLKADQGLSYSVQTTSETEGVTHVYDSTQLITIDAEGGVEFARGIGEKRRAMAIRALEAFQTHFIS